MPPAKRPAKLRSRPAGARSTTCSTPAWPPRALAARPGPRRGPAAVTVMPPNEQLDFPGFVERCKSAVTAFQHQIVKKRRQKDDQKRRQARKAVSCPTWSQRPAAGCEG